MNARIITAWCAGLAAIITAFGVIFAKLDDIHILVNSRLSKALNEIVELRMQVDALTVPSRGNKKLLKDAVIDSEK